MTFGEWLELASPSASESESEDQEEIETEKQCPITSTPKPGESQAFTLSEDIASKQNKKNCKPKTILLLYLKKQNNRFTSI